MYLNQWDAILYQKQNKENKKNERNVQQFFFLILILMEKGKEKL